METKPKVHKRASLPALIITVNAIVVLLLVALNSVYYVTEGEYGIIKRFNKVVAVVENPGIGFKTPFIDSKSSLTKRMCFYDVSPSEALTKDKKSMIIDTYAIWTITEPLQFLQSVGNTAEMERRLEATIYGSLKTTIGSLSQIDIIQSRTNNSINEAILNNSAPSLVSYGVRLQDIQIKMFDLPVSNKQAVFDRMISERNQIVATYLAEGAEEANKIRTKANNEKAVLLSEAKSESAKLIAEGESVYMKTLGAAYNSPERADFYEFIRGLDALKITMQGDKTLILSGDSKLINRITQGE